MSLTKLIENTENHIKALFENEGTGHDWWHIDRVRNVAVKLAEMEGADLEITELGALLHDIADHKFHDNDFSALPRATRAWLISQEAPLDLVDRVEKLVTEISFKGAKVATDTTSIEAACVQDADRLDAIGAIGIARAFAYGGANKRLLHHPDFKPTMHDDPKAYASDKGPTIAHFYEKLLLLKDRMQTNSGKALAAERHLFMETYLKQFFKEWEGQG
ncbi:MAG: HD domain-containing protein [Flavobacteriales bacterium]|nr:HD domain-containing protein [Flavobacteriales bacterium]